MTRWRKDRSPDQAHAIGIFPNTLQGHAERRRDDVPAQIEEHQKPAEHVEVSGLPEHGPAEEPEQRLQRHARQAVVAAGEPHRLVGGLVDDRADAERDHDERQARQPQDQRTDRQREQSRRSAARQSARHASCQPARLTRAAT